MDPFLILLLGMIVVVGSILGLRLPAFVALLSGAFLVAILTPHTSIQTFEFEKKQRNHERDSLKKRKKELKDKGQTLTDKDRAEAKTFATSKSTADEKDARKLADETLGERLARGFGGMALKIGILIAMASIVGKCLLDSGAADRIVRSMLRLFGETRAAIAFVLSGFLLGIPVFFDTVFYLMIPLGKAMSMRTGKNYVLYILSITAGGSMAHSLVPPTPGPLTVAGELGVDLGMMIMVGCVVGLFTAMTGFAFAHWANRRMVVPIRDVPESPAQGEQDESQLPPTWLSLLPILLPVIFISGDTIFKAVLSAEEYDKQVIIRTLGNKNVALMVAAAIAIGTLVWKKHPSKEKLQSTLQEALSSAGMIILITAAGGTFGAVLQQTNVSGRIEDLNLAAGSDLIWLPIAFLVTALVRTAQGSATVAMIVAAGIMASPAMQIESYHLVYLALAIGCGSKPIAWMNDSGFWVICKMSGMTEKETLKTVTPMSILMGLVGLAVVMIGASLIPLK